MVMFSLNKVLTDVRLSSESSKLTVPGVLSAINELLEMGKELLNPLSM